MPATALADPDATQVGDLLDSDILQDSIETRGHTLMDHSGAGSRRAARRGRKHRGPGSTCMSFNGSCWNTDSRLHDAD